jgi:hypothetical protein
MKTRPTRAALVGLVLGYGVIGFGAIGLLEHLAFDKVTRVALWVAGADVLHDFVLAPLVCIIGLALARWVPPVWRWPVRAAAIGTGIVLAVSYPALRGFGRQTAPGNATVLPRDYTTAVLTILGVIWTVALATGAVAMLRGHRS